MQRPQFSLRSAFWVTAAIAYVAALCSNLSRHSLPGLIVTLAAHSAVWFAICLYRLRQWRDPFDADAA